MQAKSWASIERSRSGSRAGNGPSRSGLERYPRFHGPSQGSNSFGRGRLARPSQAEERIDALDQAGKTGCRRVGGRSITSELSST